MRRIIIEDRIFELFPEFHRGLVIVRELSNPADQPAVAELLRAQEAKARTGDLLEDPRLAAWEEVHRKFGSNPRKYPPSIVSLIKRAAKGAQLPFINAVVALFNYISLKYLLPCGGDDVERMSGDLVLGPAKGDETFIPLGGSKAENPQPGEVIYFDRADRMVMCRRWNWRNGDQTKIETGSRRLVINLDCFPPVEPGTGNQARDELARLLAEHCQAEVRTDYLNSGRREVELDF